MRPLRLVTALAVLAAGAIVTVVAAPNPPQVVRPGAAALADAAVPVASAATVARVIAPPSADQKAAIVPQTFDVVTVYEVRQLHDALAAQILAAAHDAGAEGLVVDGGTLGLTRVRRGATVVQQAPAGFRYPMSSSAVPTDLAGRVMGRDLARLLTQGTIVMSDTSASLHGVKAGDLVDLLGWDNAIHTFTVGAVAPEAQIGGTELVVSPDEAVSMGFVRPARVVIWGFTSHQAIDNALAAHGLVKPTIRIRRSWDPPDPDDTLSTSQMKVALGEFAYAGCCENMTLEPGWQAAHVQRVAFRDVGVVSSCNKTIIASLQGAFTEIAANGLAGGIDLGNTNTYGGCFHAHEITPLPGGTTGGNVSRHSWGGAIDMNTVQNAEGAVPKMDCRIVRIFRKWGFAWGGNFLSSDGMHFEYVGERRDNLVYPSRYCPNPASGASVDTPGVPAPALPASTTATIGTSRVFAGDGGDR